MQTVTNTGSDTPIRIVPRRTDLDGKISRDEQTSFNNIIYNRSTTVKAWSEKHEFSYNSVKAVLNGNVLGRWGKAATIKQQVRAEISEELAKLN